MKPIWAMLCTILATSVFGAAAVAVAYFITSTEPGEQALPAIPTTADSKPTRAGPVVDTRGWTIVRQLANDHQGTTTVVEIQPEFAKQRSVYDNAVKEICFVRPHGTLCTIGFFLPGDATPTTGRLIPGGETGFKTVAFWWSNDASGVKEYTGWDCARAGVEGAPTSALCGRGVKEAYDLVLNLGDRQGIGEFCNWPPRRDIASTLSTVLSEMAKYAREDQLNQLKSAYAQQVESGRNGGRVERSIFIDKNNGGYDCKAYRAKTDAMLDEAVSSWRAAIRGRSP